MEKIPTNKKLEILKKIHDKVDELLGYDSTYHPEFVQWHVQAVSWIERIFGVESNNLKRFKMVDYEITEYRGELIEGYDAYLHSLHEAQAILKSMIEEVELLGDIINSQENKVERSETKKEKSIKSLKELIDQLQNVRNKDRFSKEFTDWNELAKSRIRSIFSKESDNLIEFKDIIYNPSVLSSRTPENVRNDAFQNGLEQAEAMLLAMVDEVDNWFDDEVIEISTKESSDIEDTGKIFIVYGHDKLALHSAKTLIYELGLKPITVTPGESEGGYIFSTIERLANECCFALVLLTPDDEGKSKSEKDYKDRARQNIIFEWGYFNGIYGIKRVCAAYKKGVEMPSDMEGIFYYPFKDEVSEIKDEFIKRLKSCKIKYKTE